MKETVGAVSLCLVFAALALAAPAFGVDSRLSPERFAAIDPVFEGLIPATRKNQAPAIIRRALAEVAKRCARLGERDRLQLALRSECRAFVKRERFFLRMRDCRGMRGCGRVFVRAGREYGRALSLAQRANRVYRRQVSGRCLKSLLTPKSDLRLMARLRFRFIRLGRAYLRRDGLDIFVEHLMLDQVIADIDDDGPQARLSWRAFRAACRPTISAGQTAPSASAV